MIIEVDWFASAWCSIGACSGVLASPPQAWEQIAATAMLAVKQFNERDPTVLSVLGSEPLQACGVQMRPTLIDSESKPIPAVSRCPCTHPAPPCRTAVEPTLLLPNVCVRWRRHCCSLFRVLCNDRCVVEERTFRRPQPPRRGRPSEIRLLRDGHDGGKPVYY